MGYNTNLANRICRGLGKLANVLYGIFSNLDIEFISDRIVESRTEKQNDNYLIKKKIRIV